MSVCRQQRLYISKALCLIREPKQISSKKVIQKKTLCIFILTNLALLTQQGFEVKPLLQEHSNHPNWGEFVNNLLLNDKFEYPK
jgi:hypothetical protein